MVKLRKPTQNLIVDIAAFVALVVMIATGFMLRYVLPPGSGSFAGAHGGGQRMVNTVWGLTRHDWGDIHFWASIALMGILAVHLALHWQWIVAMIKGRKTESSGRRLALGIVGAVGLILVAVAPLLSPVQQQPRHEPPPAVTADPAADTVEVNTLPSRERQRQHR